MSTTEDSRPNWLQSRIDDLGRDIHDTPDWLIQRAHRSAPQTPSYREELSSLFNKDEKEALQQHAIALVDLAFQAIQRVCMANRHVAE